MTARRMCRMCAPAVLLAATSVGIAADTYAPSETTRIAFLGTGTPNADPGHSGPSVAVLVDGTPYIVDFGPGVVRRAAALAAEYGGPLASFDVASISLAFLTHLHSDHTTGYPDLILTPWVLGREVPLEVYGPEGLKSMTDHIMRAYSDDIKMRLYGQEPANDRGWRVVAHEIGEGVIYKDDNVTVEAFAVPHGSWPQAFGFKFSTPDRTVCISGDCRPSEKLTAACRGVDILIHEVYSQSGFEGREQTWQDYHRQFHTSTLELADIATKVKPRLLILYHQLYWGTTDDDLIEEVRSKYDGDVVSAKDLDVY
jgi:ribonuclease BN (tRNA processing enzyme)